MHRYTNPDTSLSTNPAVHHHGSSRVLLQYVEKSPMRQLIEGQKETRRLRKAFESHHVKQHQQLLQENTRYQSQRFTRKDPLIAELDQVKQGVSHMREIPAYRNLKNQLQIQNNDLRVARVQGIAAVQNQQLQQQHEDSNYSIALSYRKHKNSDVSSSVFAKRALSFSERSIEKLPSLKDLFKGQKADIFLRDSQSQRRRIDEIIMSLERKKNSFDALPAVRVDVDDNTNISQYDDHTSHTDKNNQLNNSPNKLNTSSIAALSTVNETSAKILPPTYRKRNIRGAIQSLHRTVPVEQQQSQNNLSMISASTAQQNDTLAEINSQQDQQQPMKQRRMSVDQQQSMNDYSKNQADKTQSLIKSREYSEWLLPLLPAKDRQIAEDEKFVVSVFNSGESSNKKMVKHLESNKQLLSSIDSNVNHIQQYPQLRQAAIDRINQNQELSDMLTSMAANRQRSLQKKRQILSSIYSTKTQPTRSQRMKAREELKSELNAVLSENKVQLRRFQMIIEDMKELRMQVHEDLIAALDELSDHLNAGGVIYKDSMKSFFMRISAHNIEAQPFSSVIAALLAIAK